MVARSANILFSVCPLIFLVTSSEARTWYIKPDATGDAPTIQAAMDSTSPGDTVLVARGTYTWTSQGATEHSMIQLARDVVFRSESGAEATVLDAESQGRVLLLYHAGAARVEGFTVQNGLSFFAKGYDPPLFDFGAGIYALGESQPVISDCIVRNNHGQIGSAGAGICCTTPGSRIERCLVTENWGDAQSRGGGIACFGGSIVQCTIARNGVYDSEGAQGGGIYAQDCTISDCLILENEASAGGGASGGGIYVVGPSSNISRCVLIGNMVQATHATGGGIRVLSGNCEIADCLFVGNRAIGGAAALGAAVGVGRATVQVVRCTIVSNVATGNQATGGICSYAGFGGRVISSIISDNEGAACRGTGLAFSCTNIFGNSHGDTLCGMDLGNNFSLDPQFCAIDPDSSANLSLQSDSPCAPGNHPQGAACGLIGAAPVGCQSVSVIPKTWGDVKSLYRR